MNNVFLVIAYRMGQERGYHFPVGVFDSFEKAKEEAIKHGEYRGGKYDHKIFNLFLNEALDAEEAIIVGGTGNFKSRKT